jgi:hypothetical protein
VTFRQSAQSCAELRSLVFQEERCPVEDQLQEFVEKIVWFKRTIHRTRPDFCGDGRQNRLFVLAVREMHEDVPRKHWPCWLRDVYPVSGSSPVYSDKS